MSIAGQSDERKVAVMLIAMQDMRAEMEGMLKALQAGVRATDAASVEVARAGAAVVPAVTKATSTAVAASMKLAFADVVAPAKTALEQALQPVLERFAGLEQRAVRLEKTAQNAMRWFSTKWIALTAAGFAGMCGLAWVSVEWQRHELTVLTEQKVALAADIAEMQSKVGELTKKGGRVRTNTCGGRFCIVASADQGEGAPALNTKWIDPKTSEPLVIPAGY